MNSQKEKIKSYVIELAIVTIGVLIALFLSNLKEYNQAREYHSASITTIDDEIKSNYSELNEVVKKQTNLLDTLTKYTEDTTSISDIFKKSNGMLFPTIYNTGLEFYKRNQMNSIDFEMMSTLINMNLSSDIIDKKLDKFSEFVFSNAFSNSKESKMTCTLHLQNVLNIEYQLLESYKDYIDNKIENKND